jgi:hypothetical protein
MSGGRLCGLFALAVILATTVPIHADCTTAASHADVFVPIFVRNMADPSGFQPTFIAFHSLFRIERGFSW